MFEKFLSISSDSILNSKKDDFFPYAHRPHSFWTGYFTSRPALKSYIRQSSQILQSVRHLVAFANMTDNKTVDNLFSLEQSLGIAQHHDAISGTERQVVAYDYAKRLSIGVENSLELAKLAMNILKIYNSNDDIFFCLLLNISQCKPLENSRYFSVTLYNPLPRAVNYWINIPVTESSYAVSVYNQEIWVDSECSPIYSNTQMIPERDSGAEFNLAFLTYIEANSFSKYSVQPLNNLKVSKSADLKFSKNEQEGNFIFKNEFLSLSFDSSGNLKQIDNLDTGLTMKMNQSYCIYQSYPGNNSDSQFQASGAYIFRSFINEATCLSVNSFRVYQGKLFMEIYQQFNNYLSQTIRLYTYWNNIEINWQVGPIDIGDNLGKEIVSKFETDLMTNETFYTDSNGREILQRVRDYRPTWKLNQTEPISGNYYPVNSRIFIRDESKQTQLTIVTDRSQGGSSLNDGSIELMLHRRILQDDGLGLNEALNETGPDGEGLVVKGALKLILNTTSNSAKLHRLIAHQVNNPPLVSFTKNMNEKTGKSDEIKSIKQRISLPSNLHLLTLLMESAKNQNTILVRIEHFYEKDEDTALSMPVTVNLKEYFQPYFNITNYVELALGANMNVTELDERLKWNSERSGDINRIRNSKSKSEKNLDFIFTFNPMQIRTFRFYV